MESDDEPMVNGTGPANPDDDVTMKRATEHQEQRDIRLAVEEAQRFRQALLDALARTHNYRNMVSKSTHVESQNLSLQEKLKGAQQQLDAKDKEIDELRREIVAYKEQNGSMLDSIKMLQKEMETKHNDHSGILQAMTNTGTQVTQQNEELKAQVKTLEAELADARRKPDTEMPDVAPAITNAIKEMPQLPSFIQSLQEAKAIEGGPTMELLDNLNGQLVAMVGSPQITSPASEPEGQLTIEAAPVVSLPPSPPSENVQPPATDPNMNPTPAENEKALSHARKLNRKLKKVAAQIQTETGMPPTIQQVQEKVQNIPPKNNVSTKRTADSSPDGEEALVENRTVKVDKKKKTRPNTPDS